MFYDKIWIDLFQFTIVVFFLPVSLAILFVVFRSQNLTLYNQEDTVASFIHQNFIWTLNNYAFLAFWKPNSHQQKAWWISWRQTSTSENITSHFKIHRGFNLMCFALFQICSRQKLVHITQVCWSEVTYLRIDVNWWGK